MLLYLKSDVGNTEEDGRYNIIWPSWFSLSFH